MRFRANPIVVASIALGLTACGGSGTPAPPAFDNFQAASVVIGQPDYVSSGDNSGAGQDNPGDRGFQLANSMAISDNGALYVSDFSLNRITGFAGGVPAMNGAAATFVLGQGSFTSRAFDMALTHHPRVSSVHFGAGKMAVAHDHVNRVVIFNTPHQEPFAQPDHVVGQTRDINDGPECRIDALTRPTDAFITPDGKLIVADWGNHRVLIWNTPDAPAPTLVLGQSSFERCAFNDDNQDGTSDGAPTARTVSPIKVWSDGVRLVVTDPSNHRVLIWRQFPTSNFQTADVVLGQESFTGAAPNDDNQDGLADARPSSRTMHTPSGIAVDGERVAIADANNNRVLIWERFPTRNFQPADSVLGHLSFANGAENDGDQDGAPDQAPSEKTLHRPQAVLFHGGDLLVNDLGNDRILLFKRRP